MVGQVLSNLRRLVLLAIAVLLLACTPASNTSPHITSLSGGLRFVAADSLGGISESKGDLLFAEQFQSPPLGCNSSEWNLIEINDPSLAWMDEESLDLWGEKFKTVLLRSNEVFGPGVIAEINASFTQGTCYSCIGWCDEWHDQESDWIANGRICRNGVFIDCWDGELFLVAYADGDRTVTPIDIDDLTGWHKLNIEWTESIVRLEVDTTPVAFVSRTVPRLPLTMTFIVSGHHSRVEPGRLSLESVSVYEYQRESKPSDPDIVLLRPENYSIVYPGDFLDFEVRGAASNLSCSWEKGPSFKVGSPWDIPVPGIIYGLPIALPASVHLTVDAVNTEGHHSTTVLTFRIDEREFEFGVWLMPEKPVVDGTIDENEAKRASRLDVDFRSECREEIGVSLWVGYTSDSLYVAVESPMPDSYHSRATLFLDANADGEWSIESSDFGVTIASPLADPTYTCVFGTTDGLIPGLTYDVSENDGVVIYEFLVPLEFLNADEEEGIAFGIQLSHGGHNLEFPDKYYLGVVYSLGHPASNPHTWQVILLGAVLLMTGSVVVVSIYMSRRETLYLEHATHEEPLKRMKILLLSYERIDLERLSRMMDLETHAAEALVEDLILHGFPVYRVNDEIVRLRKVAEKNENNIL